MKKAVKVAISLPAETLEAIERDREATGESRSQFVRRAVEGYVRHQREKDAMEQYVRGYTEQPEAPEDEAWAQAGLEALAHDPWE